MACSINGFIADEKGNEKFLSYRNYEIMLGLLKQHDVLIWGRKTFDNVKSWGKNYLEDLKNTNIIILSKDSKESKSPNINFCRSLDDCLDYCKNNNYKKILISGGASINNLFMENNLVNKIILNYNPYVLAKGIPLFKGNNFKDKLKLNKIIQEGNIVQIHYDLNREDN